VPIGKGLINQYNLRSRIRSDVCLTYKYSINQMMEVEQDKIMMRTKKRPLPTGRISKLHAGIQAAVLGLAGTATLYHFINPITAALGAANIVLYTCLYTPLKVFFSFKCMISEIHNSWRFLLIGSNGIG